MSKSTSTNLRTGGVGAIIGAVIITIIGFSFGGWVTSSTANEMSEEAVLANRSTICVAQFMGAKDFKAQLKVIEDTESWDRHRRVEAGGWDKMPGEKESAAYVSQACARGIEALLDK